MFWTVYRAVLKLTDEALNSQQTVTLLDIVKATIRKALAWSSRSIWPLPWGCWLSQLRKGPVGRFATWWRAMSDRRDHRIEVRSNPRASGGNRLARLEATVDTLTLCVIVATAVLLVDLF
jgi:hypothetical protein